MQSEYGRGVLLVVASTPLEAVAILHQMRKSMKSIVLVICVLFVASLLYVGGSFFTNKNGARGSVVAKVNGTAIHQAEFQQSFLSQLQQYEQQLGKLSGMQVEQVKMQVLNGLLNQDLALQLVKKEGIKVNNKDVDDQLSKIESQYASKAVFQQVLQQNGLTESKLRDEIRQQLELKNLQDSKSKVTVTDDDVKKAYESVQAAAVLFAATGDAKDPSWAKAEAKAKEAKAKLDKGASWSSIVKAYGDASDQANGGSLGWIHRSDPYPAPLIDAAFGLKKNESAGPVKTDQGYYLVQVTDRKDAVGADFEKAKADLKTQLEQSRGQDAFSQWFDEQRKQATIVVNDPELRGLQFMSDGQYPQAVAQFEDAISAQPSDPNLHWLLAEAFVQVKDDQRALDEYKKAADLDKSSYEIQMALGQEYQKLKQNDAAIAAYEQASLLAGKSQQSYMVHAQLQQLFTQVGAKKQADQEQQMMQDIEKQYEAQLKAQQEAQAKQKADADKQSAASGATSDGKTAAASTDAKK